MYQLACENGLLYMLSRSWEVIDKFFFPHLDWHLTISSHSVWIHSTDKIILNFCLQIGRKMSKLKRHRRKQVLNDPTLSRPDPPPHCTDLPIENTSPPAKNLSSTLVSAKTLMDLFVCKQDQGESVRAFFARVNQIASRVPLSKLCDCGCNNLVSFASETMFHLVLVGSVTKIRRQRVF